MIVVIDQVRDAGSSGQSRNGNKGVDSCVNYAIEGRKGKEGERVEKYTSLNNHLRKRET